MYALGHNITYSYNKRSAYNIIISISALTGPCINERAEIDGGTYVYSEVLFTQFEGCLQLGDTYHLPIACFEDKGRSTCLHS